MLIQQLCACIAYAIRLGKRAQATDSAHHLWKAMHCLTTRDRCSRGPTKISLPEALDLDKPAYMSPVALCGRVEGIDANHVKKTSGPLNDGTFRIKIEQETATHTISLSACLVESGIASDTSRSCRHEAETQTADKVFIEVECQSLTEKLTQTLVTSMESSLHKH